MTVSYCQETARRHDPGRFLLSMFAPPEYREDIWALIAFNHEIAKTREVVTETQLGLIRLQWWRDALAGVYERGAVAEHQVLQPLAAAIQKHDLPREWFDNLIYAREFDLEDRLPSTLEGLVKYADYTATPLLKLQMKIKDAMAYHTDIHAAATGFALTGLLRAVPAHLRQRRCYLPEDLIAREGMTVYDLYDGTGIAKLPAVVAAVADAADKQFASLTADVPRTLRLIRCYGRMHLDQLRRCGHDVFSPRLAAPPFLREAKLWWASIGNH